MKTSYDIIKRPIITEKSALLAEKAVYTFEVAKDANKIEIAKAVEKAFKVTVEKVTVVNVLPKAKRVGQHAGFKSAYKKAYVTLKAGDKIDSFNL